MIALLVTTAACVWAVVATPDSGRVLVAWCAGATAVLLSVAVALAVHGRDAARFHAGRAAQVRAESAHLADQLVPALIGRLRAGSSPETALAEIEEPVDPRHQLVLRTLAEEVGRGERMRAAAMAACANAAGRVQALATSMLADLREMEERHSEEVLGDLLKLDHSTAQAGRLADSIAVLTGARSGRRWTKPIVMESILRGAVGRVSAYQRVRTHSASTVAVVGYAAEGVMHALAELIDNATSFSPPSEQVHVYVEEVQTGVVVTIEDGGLVMGDLALRRAEQAVSSETLDLTTLSGTRLGLAVVGCLARKHGLTVSFRPSSRGGTGVVVMIPRQLITEPRQSGTGKRRFAGSSRAPATVATSAPLQLPTAADVEAATGVTAEAPAADGAPPELPRRARGRTLAATFPAPQRRAAEPAPRADAGARFGAFRNAGRPAAASGNNGTVPEFRLPAEETPAQPEQDLQQTEPPQQDQADARPDGLQQEERAPRPEPETAQFPVPDLASGPQFPHARTTRPLPPPREPRQAPPTEDGPRWPT
ncbi:ATP-binding protein [Umezawaea beigongshangensis]|uniref:sensor histidine kinase n=1 Tax=Umezawaea beigongshangensis TaxID=2780383 RepID=UPI003F689167